jgi:CrcB protein
MNTVLIVALGGALGASLRYLCGVAVLRVWSGSFPVAIMAVNIAGSFLMGMALVFFAGRDMAQAQVFVMVGVLGGFTTFSTFSMEAFMLLERGAIGAAALYVCASVAVSVAGLGLGVAIGRGIFS